MKILLVHTRYKQAGGEDVVVDVQRSVLTGRGHEVVMFERDNRDIDVNGATARLRAAGAAVWSRRAQVGLASAIEIEAPDVVHVHNTFPSMSPSVYAAANAAGVPVVQHLHNARLVCIDPTLVREARACTDCVGRRIPWPGVVHRCYRDSLPESGVAASVQMAHHALGTWARRVDLFLPVSDWLGRLMVDSGALPAAKVLSCHSALDPDPGRRPSPSSSQPDAGYALFAGRLSAEKGVDVLVEAAARAPGLAVKIAGDGPERPRLEALVEQLGATNVELLGQVPRAQLLDLLRGASVVVAPSLGDALNMSVVEAAAVGVPVIASECGGLPEAVVDGETGHLVPPGDVARLAARLSEAAARPEQMWAMGIAARAHFERHFTAAAFADRLLAAYEQAGTNAAAAGTRRGLGRVGRPRRLNPQQAGQVPPGP